MKWLRSVSERRRRAWVLPIAFLSAIGFCDVLAHVLHTSTVGLAMLDEPAHLSTAAVLLYGASLVAASRGRGVPALSITVALASSVLIDIDHVPQAVFGSDIISVGTGRPYSHSLVTPVVALVLACAAGGRTRRFLFGVATGVLLHFVRDLFTGPGLPLAWPFSDDPVRLPYVGYWLVLLLSALVAVAAGTAFVAGAGRYELGRRSRALTAGAEEAADPQSSA